MGTQKRFRITLWGTDMVPRIELVGLLGFALLAIPATAQTVGCVIDAARNGEVVKIRGQVFATGHDVFVRPNGCQDNRVVLVYGDDRSLGKAKLAMKRDESFQQFEKYLNEQQPSKPDEICKECPKYRITADFDGRLDIAPSAGLKKDPKTGKVIGIEGFGHPVPFTRYQLVVTGVSDVEAVERVVPDH
jgi:hypothetical protein